MPTQRQERINKLLQREISDIIRREMEDPHLHFLTITGVKVSQDIGHAEVFVSVLGTPEEARETIQTLGHARSFIRGQLGERLDLRFIPMLRFRLDDTAARAQKMDNLIREQAEAIGEREEPAGDADEQ